MEQANKVKRTIEYMGFTCVGTIVCGDWTGDPNVARGALDLPPYVQDVEVYTEGAGGFDVTDMLTDEALLDIELELLSE